MQLLELTAYLDDYLAIEDIPDYRDAWNGLQVQSEGDIRKIAVAVDACRYTIEKTIEEGAQLLLVHHGLFWGTKPPLTGNYFNRVAPLIKSNTALYSAHLPLDVHPEVGNNPVLARLLGLPVTGSFGKFEGLSIGLLSDVEMTVGELAERGREVLKIEPKLIGDPARKVKRTALLTGGGGSLISEAAKAGADVYLTGEGNHHTYFEAVEWGIDILYAGHYATETVGVKALATHLENRFGLETVFIDFPTGL